MLQAYKVSSSILVCFEVSLYSLSILDNKLSQFSSFRQQVFTISHSIWGVRNWEWLSWEVLAQGVFTKLRSRHRLGQQSSEGLTGACISAFNVSDLQSWWDHTADSKPQLFSTWAFPLGSLIVLMTQQLAFPGANGPQERARWKSWCSLWPSLGIYPPSFPLHCLH